MEAFALSALTLLCFCGSSRALHERHPQQQWGMVQISVEEPLEGLAGDVLHRLLDSGPPPFKEHARMARYIVHNSDWTSMATTSVREAVKGYPMANVFSVSDGSTTAKSSGTPYFYISPLEISAQDLEVDNRASITMSLAQGAYCKEQQYDPEDPRCAHVILTGKFTKLAPGSEEEAFAKDALFTRHPVMATWPASHDWFFAKLDIENIMLLDFFGGVKTVTLDDYLAATPY